jgi:hypothetical protein
VVTRQRQGTEGLTMRPARGLLPLEHSECENA